MIIIGISVKETVVGRLISLYSLKMDFNQEHRAFDYCDYFLSESHLNSCISLLRIARLAGNSITMHMAFMNVDGKLYEFFRVSQLVGILWIDSHNRDKCKHRAQKEKHWIDKGKKFMHEVLRGEKAEWENPA